MSLSSKFVTRSGRGLLDGSNYVCRACTRRLYSRDVVKENDIVLLKHRRSSGAPVITDPLHPGRTVKIERDSIKHEDIIGKSMREVIGSRRKVLYRILQPTLAEYTDNSPRLVTPIYSQDASLIVSLLDLHPTLPGSQSAEEDRLEIFEAGTGHGALTLQLARAIHAANTAPPKIPELASESSTPATGRKLKLDTEVDAESEKENDIQEQQKTQAETVIKLAYDEWRSTRRAVIHTFDISETHSVHAENVVKRFRQGLYYPHIDFHVGKIEDYLSARLLETNQEPFLEHAILDLPATQDYFAIVGKALKPNGTLLVFCPSITQIIECVKHVKDKKHPFFLEQTVEVGRAVGVGGREWDVRSLKPRALLKAEGVEQAEGSKASASVSSTNDEGWEMVCRPKVGVKISGGGFAAQFRKEVKFSAPDL